MIVREIHLTAKNKLVIALALMALMAAGAVLFAVGMTLLVAAIAVVAVAGGFLAARSRVRRAFGRPDPAPLASAVPLDPSREVFPSARARAPRLRGRNED
ncbi:MAG: hypothetical protein ABJD07_03180 [Gemmatimonadaceae bacterium]